MDPAKEQTVDEAALRRISRAVIFRALKSAALECVSYAATKAAFLIAGADCPECRKEYAPFKYIHPHLCAPDKPGKPCAAPDIWVERDRVVAAWTNAISALDEDAVLGKAPP